MLCAVLRLDDFLRAVAAYLPGRNRALLGRRRHPPARLSALSGGRKRRRRRLGVF